MKYHVCYYDEPYCTPKQKFSKRKRRSFFRMKKKKIVKMVAMKRSEQTKRKKGFLLWQIDMHVEAFLTVSCTTLRLPSNTPAFVSPLQSIKKVRLRTLEYWTFAHGGNESMGSFSFKGVQKWGPTLQRSVHHTTGILHVCRYLDELTLQHSIYL